MVLDAGTTVFVWIGAHANALEIAESTAFAQRYIEMTAAVGMGGARGGLAGAGARDKATDKADVDAGLCISASVVTVPCGAEPCDFSMHFASWQPEFFHPYLSVGDSDGEHSAEGALNHVVHMNAEVTSVLAMGDEVKKHGAFVTSDALHEQLVDIHKMMRPEDMDRQIGGGMAAQAAAMAARRKQASAGSEGYVVVYSRPAGAQTAKKGTPKKSGGGGTMRRGSFVKTTPRRSVFEGGIRKGGELEKKGKGVMAGWQRRYFTCQGHYLRYKGSKDDSPRVVLNNDEESAIADATATKGVIDLNSITKLELKCGSAAADDGDDACVKIVITSEVDKGCVVIKLRAQGQADGEAWVSSMLAGMEAPLKMVP
jgi:hypothetical protein